MSDPPLFSIPLDRTTVLMLDMLAGHDAHQPPVPDSDTMNQYQLSEAALKHYEWERMRQANWLMVAARLVNIGLGANYDRSSSNAS